MQEQGNMEETAACPKAPNPCADIGLEAEEKAQGAADSMLVLTGEDWDFSIATATGALKLLIASVSAIAELTGDVPPTPPASRPTTPGPSDNRSRPGPGSKAELEFPMSPLSPISPSFNHGQTIVPVLMPSPEAHRDEHIPAVGADADAEAVALQQMAISRRFYLKSVPPFTLSQYLLRIHQYCPHSPGVYLTAAAYLHRLCVTDMLVPATNKTIHRLCLAAIRVASKALEDHKWSQDRVAKVGGVSRRELKSLEINLCFLLDFDLFVKEAELKRRTFLLQQASKQGKTIERRLSTGFRTRLPVRNITEATEVG